MHDILFAVDFYVVYKPVIFHTVSEQFALYNDLELRRPSDKSVCLRSCGLGFDSESGQSNDFKIGIRSIPACQNTSTSLLVVQFKRALSGISPS